MNESQSAPVFPHLHSTKKSMARYYGGDDADRPRAHTTWPAAADSPAPWRGPFRTSTSSAPRLVIRGEKIAVERNSAPRPASTGGVDRPARPAIDVPTASFAVPTGAVSVCRTVPNAFSGRSTHVARFGLYFIPLNARPTPFIAFLSRTAPCVTRKAR